jgi:hypothetical protein
MKEHKQTLLSRSSNATTLFVNVSPNYGSEQNSRYLDFRPDVRVLLGYRIFAGRALKRADC